MKYVHASRAFQIDFLEDKNYNRILLGVPLLRDTSTYPCSLPIYLNYLREGSITQSRAS